MANKSLASALKNNTENNPINDLTINNSINNPNIVDDKYSKNQNESYLDNNSCASLNSNQTLGVDFTQLLQEYG